MKRAHIALLLALLPCVLTRLHHPVPDLKLSDFQVYYVGAHLVRAGEGPRLYAGADTGNDPQQQPAPPSSPMAMMGRSLGLPAMQLYLYPPLMADLLLPLTHTDLRTATRIWLLANLCLLGLTVLALAVALNLPLMSRGTMLLLVALLCYTPVISCFSWGQVTILLLCLWAVGAAAYARGYPVWSGVAFALATAIKLTPILVLVPFVLWWEWRWIRAFVGTLLASLLAMAYLNTPSAIQVYFGKVVPAMSHSIPDPLNLSIVAGIEVLDTVLHGHAIYPTPVAGPQQAMLLGKLISLILLATTFFFMFRVGRRMRLADRVTTIALLSFVAPIISPVSWYHAYAVAFVALAFLWRDAIRNDLSTVYLAGLTLASFLVSSYLPTFALKALASQSRHNLLIASFVLAELLLWFAVVSYRLSQMRPEILARTSDPVEVPAL